MSGKIASKTLCFLVTVLLLWPAARADGSDDSDDDSLEATNVLLFLFFGLGMGVLVMQLLSFWGEPVPYTVVVFFMGAIFSLANSSYGTFGKSIGDWIHINADLMLFVFLPPLIFGEAMSLNWYHVKGGLLQSIILAGPGVLICAAMMGSFAKILLPYDWAWNFAMMFGAILAATDTVAVVSLLKSVGASPKLTIVFCGESLLNDGTALVLFTIFYNSCDGKLYTPAEVFGFLVSATAGSIAIGVVIGLLTVQWLRSANRPLVETDVTIQIAVTICTAYLVFFLAQNTLEISGPLACCSAGAMLAWLAPPIILNHESMHNVWGMMEWALNTAIFLLAGLIVGNRILGHVNAVDWIYLAIFYGALMAFRFLTMILLYPFISNIGHKCSPQEAVFLSWAGLRGALAMALAIIVEDTLPDDIDDEKKRLFFYVGGIASLTLLINATTSKTLLLKLGLLSADSAEKALVTAQIKRKLQRKTNKFIKAMAKDFKFTEAEVEEVRMSCTLLNDMNMTGLMRDTDLASTLLANTMNPLANDLHHPSADDAHHQAMQSESSSMSEGKSSFNTPGGASRRGSMRKSHESRKARLSASMMHVQKMSRWLSTPNRGPESLMHKELMAYVRSIFLEIVRVKYWNLIESGKLPRLSFSAQFLLYTVDVGVDNVERGVGVADWQCLLEELNAVPMGVNALTLYERIAPASCTGWSTKLLTFIATRYEKREVYMLDAFIEAHEHAQVKLRSFLGLNSSYGDSERGSRRVADDDDDDDDNGDENKDGREEADSSVTEIPCPELTIVIQESKKAVSDAKVRLGQKNPQTIATIKSKQAARLVLARQAELVKNMVDEGLLSPQHAEIFLEEITLDTQRIEKERNRMYAAHTDLKARQAATKKDERSTGTQARPSMLGFLVRPSRDGRASQVELKEHEVADLSSSPAPSRSRE